MTVVIQRLIPNWRLFVNGEEVYLPARVQCGDELCVKQDYPTTSPESPAIHVEYFWEADDD